MSASSIASDDSDILFSKGPRLQLPDQDDTFYDKGRNEPFSNLQVCKIYVYCRNVIQGLDI